jgi:hypothetical protein
MGGRAPVAIPVHPKKLLDMHSKSLHAALASACLAVGLCASSQAEPVAVPAGSARIGAQVVPPYIRALIAARQAIKPSAVAPRTAGTIDTLAPVLTAFNTVASVDVGVPGSAVSVSFKATDDLSGLASVYAWAEGPSRQWVDVSFDENVPLTSLSGKMHSTTAIPAFLEPGVYKFVGAYTVDFAGNGQNIDQATLAALGKVSFTVKNKSGFDITPPTLVSGKVMTPRVDLSVPHAGTEYDAPFVRVNLSATDAGNTAVSGVKYASATFCLLDRSSCFYLLNTASEMDPMATSANLRLGGRVSDSNNPPGDYILSSVMVVDFAGNSNSWHSTVFDGQTDFSTYFPSTTIKLVP